MQTGEALHLTAELLSAFELSVPAARHQPPLSISALFLREQQRKDLAVAWACVARGKIFANVHEG